MPSQVSVFAIIYLPLLINCINGLKNVNNLQQFIATEKIQAEFYTSATYANTYDDCTQDPTITYLGDLSTATVLTYEQVDFGSGVQRVSLRVSNVFPSGAVDISLHLSSANAIPFLTVPINSTGSDKCAFVTVNLALQVIPSGKQNLYITISSGEGGQLFLDWFQFNQTSGGVIPATERIQAEDYDYAVEMVVYKNCTDVTVYADNYYQTLVEYYQVDFGTGVQRVNIRFYNTDTSTAAQLFFHTGSSSNPAFATINVNYTGDYCNFSEVSADVIVVPTGVQNLFITYDSGYYRDTYLDSFVFVREDGQWNATENIEAEAYTSAGNISLYADCSDPGITYVGGLLPNSVLEYDGVDFGSGVETVTLRVSSIHTGPPLNVTLHLGSSTTTPLVTVNVGQTGTESCNFYTVTAFLNTPPSGVQNLFITFPAKEGGYLSLDWFSFDQTVN